MIGCLKMASRFILNALVNPRKLNLNTELRKAVVYLDPTQERDKGVLQETV